MNWIENFWTNVIICLFIITPLCFFLSLLSDYYAYQMALGATLFMYSLLCFAPAMIINELQRGLWETRIVRSKSKLYLVHIPVFLIVVVFWMVNIELFDPSGSFYIY